MVRIVYVCCDYAGLHCIVEGSDEGIGGMSASEGEDPAGAVDDATGLRSMLERERRLRVAIEERSRDQETRIRELEARNRELEARLFNNQPLTYHKQVRASVRSFRVASPVGVTVLLELKVRLFFAGGE